MAGAVSAHLVLLPGEQDGSEAARSFFFPPNFFLRKKAAGIVRSTLHPSRDEIVWSDLSGTPGSHIPFITVLWLCH